MRGMCLQAANTRLRRSESTWCGFMPATRAKAQPKWILPL